MTPSLASLLSGRAIAGTAIACLLAAAPSAQDVRPRPPVNSYLANPSFLDFAVSSQSVELGYRQLTSRADGHFGLSALANDDGDYAVSARVMRIGALVGVPVRLGVGIAGYGAWLDEVGAAMESKSAYALALTGSLEYDLPTPYKSKLSAELSVAPDITTFDDGENLYDVVVRASVDISRTATAFVGYRAFEIDLDPDHSIEKRIHIGVSLGL